MIFLTDDGPEMRATTEMVGVPVYLDQWAIIDLAIRRPDLRRRFIDALYRGQGTLIFSVANLWEIGGPQGDSKDAVRTFLSDIGPHWMPIDGVGTVLLREQADHPKAPACPEFVKAYALDRLHEKKASGESVDPSDPTFFDLGRVVDWVKTGPDPRTSDEIYAAMVAKIHEMRRRYDGGDYSCDAVVDEPLLPNKPATYVFYQLTLMLIHSAKARPFERNDFPDLCHAVMALAYGVVVTLDKKWWERANAMKHYVRLARAYYATQLEEFVADLEMVDPLNGLRPEPVSVGTL